MYLIVTPPVVSGCSCNVSVEHIIIIMCSVNHMWKCLHVYWSAVNERWSLELQAYDFNVVYHAGKNIQCADSLQTPSNHGRMGPSPDCLADWQCPVARSYPISSLWTSTGQPQFWSYLFWLEKVPSAPLQAAVVAINTFWFSPVLHSQITYHDWEEMAIYCPKITAEML